MRDDRTAPSLNEITRGNDLGDACGKLFRALNLEMLGWTETPREARAAEKAAGHKSR